ncbi:hypothetical protein [Tomitella fengzijianii]|uniref:Secreted protein n=1 Tax=Tomitella fengzijianii TaxID=2597660 RepID=A0A516X086_9ACTN|nr:hypothetical protein [Tomitella fengzijianii]QDQ96509.1 hypothetical protein FO059_03085 [Tomitella fengzijianii]
MGEKRWHRVGGFGPAAVAAALAVVGGAMAAMTLGAGTAAADPPAMTPLPGSGHEMRLHGIQNIDDVLHTDKDLILGGGDVRATTIDGVTFHYYRMVDGARQSMTRSPEICLPQIPCHAVIYDDLSPVY